MFVERHPRRHLLDIEEEPCSCKNILLNYLVVLNKKFSFVVFGNFVVCYTSVPVVIPCQLYFSETHSWHI